jgi:hypothetical protein
MKKIRGRALGLRGKCCIRLAEWPPPSDECWYFMGAVQQYATFVDPAGQVLLGACTGKTTKLTQLIRHCAFERFTGL